MLLKHLESDIKFLAYTTSHSKEWTLKINANISLKEGVKGGFEASVMQVREKSQRA